MILTPIESKSTELNEDSSLEYEILRGEGAPQPQYETPSPVIVHVSPPEEPQTGSGDTNIITKHHPALSEPYSTQAHWYVPNEKIEYTVLSHYDALEKKQEYAVLYELKLQFDKPIVPAEKKSKHRVQEDMHFIADYVPIDVIDKPDDRSSTSPTTDVMNLRLDKLCRQSLLIQVHRESPKIPHLLS